MTQEPENRCDQVKHGDKRSESGYADISESRGYGAQTSPVHMRPPMFVAMTEEQRQVALRALVDLLFEDQQRHGS